MTAGGVHPPAAVPGQGGLPSSRAPALTSVHLSPFPLLSACQLNCSDHGHCDSFTKRCICDPFWMENFIKVQLRDGDSNCGESSARHCASGFGAECSCSELSRWVVVFPRQMSKRGEELRVFSVCRGLLLPSSTLLQVRAEFCSGPEPRTRLKSDRAHTAAQVRSAARPPGFVEPQRGSPVGALRFLGPLGPPGKLLTACPAAPGARQGLCRRLKASAAYSCKVSPALGTVGAFMSAEPSCCQGRDSPGRPLASVFTAPPFCLSLQSGACCMLSLLPSSLLSPWESCPGRWSVVVRGKMASPRKCIRVGLAFVHQGGIWHLPHGRRWGSSLPVTARGRRRKAFIPLSHPPGRERAPSAKWPSPH